VSPGKLRQLQLQQQRRLRVSGTSSRRSASDSTLANHINGRTQSIQRSERGRLQSSEVHYSSSNSLSLEAAAKCDVRMCKDRD